jgi:hypothetical protein
VSARATAAAQAADVLPTHPFPVKNIYFVKFILVISKYLSKTKIPLFPN